MRLLVVGGGSAGHVLPARPIMEYFLARGDQVSFVGTTSGLEERLVADLEVNFHAIHSGKLRRYFSWQNFLDVFRILAGALQSIVLLGRLRPDVVFSKGGFVSFPVVLAAWLWRTPVVAHESDLSPGLANRLVKPFVRTFCVTFADTELPTGARVVHSGTPVRANMLSGDAVRGRELLDVASDQPIIVVTGGSLGADALNDVVRQALDTLTETYHVVHVVGPGKQSGLEHTRYTELEYVQEGWGDMIAAADIVVSRAGANALFELLSLRKLSLLVPLSRAVSRGDQIDNAAYAEREGLALVIAEAQFDVAALDAGITHLLAHHDDYQAKLRGFVLPDAVRVICEEIEAVI